MRIRLKELQGRLADQGRRVSLEDIAEATGINASAIFDISANKLKLWRPEIIDALCTYFGVTAGELLEAEAVELPLPPRRPDRRGVQVGAKTKEPPAPEPLSTAEQMRQRRRAELLAQAEKQARPKKEE